MQCTRHKISKFRNSCRDSPTSTNHAPSLSVVSPSVHRWKFILFQVFFNPKQSSGKGLERRWSDWRFFFLNLLYQTADARRREKTYCHIKWIAELLLGMVILIIEKTSTPSPSFQNIFATVHCNPNGKKTENI